MIRHWATMLNPADHMTLFLRRPLDAAALQYLGINDRITPKHLSPDMPGIIWENLRLGPATSGMDVLFCPAYTSPLVGKAPVVLATHSVNEIQPSAQSRWYPHTYGRLYRHSARNAAMVIAPCETTKRDISEYYGIKPERIAVVEQGSDDCFRPIDDTVRLGAVRTRFFGADRPYLLFVGKCSVRRNIPTLLRAFAELRHSKNIPHGLLLFGPNPDNLPLAELCEELRIRDDVVQLDGVLSDHTELVEIYNAAEVFVHPSEIEGWSMTTVEAMACGTAVIAVDRGGQGELTRGHALMLESVTVESLADAIFRVIGDTEFREKLRGLALARGSQFRWGDTTRRTLDVVERVGRGDFV
jgi:glycosyltransferase involved in cell wall biosynthesis